MNIAHIDANNLYGHAMSGTLPTDDHVMLTKAEIDAIGWEKELNRDIDESKYGYILVADILYPKELHDEPNDLPFFPEKRTVEEEELSPFQKELLGDVKFKTSKKLMATLCDQKKYTVHEKYLKLGLDHRLVMGHIRNLINSLIKIS